MTRVILGGRQPSASAHGWPALAATTSPAAQPTIRCAGRTPRSLALPPSLHHKPRLPLAMVAPRIAALALVLLAGSSAVLGSAPTRAGLSRRTQAHAELSYQRRVTAEQSRQQEELNCYQDALDEMNTAWQSAVKAGHVTDFHSFADANGGLPDPLNCLAECAE